MRFTQILVIVSYIAIASVSTIPATTASTMRIIMNDFSKLGKQFEKIAADVNSFPQTELAGVDDIHEDAAAIHTLFLDVNSNLEALPRPVSVEDAKKVALTYNSFIPNILDYLNGITDKASDFKSLGSTASSTISLDLLNAVKPCVTFGGIVMSMIPAAMTDATNVMFNEVDAARQNAIAALS